MLRVKGLGVKVEGKQVVKDFEIEIGKGETHVLIGPNGSGKSSFASALMGDQRFEVEENSTVEFLSEKNFLQLTANERARKGIMVAWQTPMVIPGVKVFTLCKAMWESMGHKIDSVVEFKKKLELILVRVGLPKEYVGRSINEGFSGGEKKRLELAQILLMKPKLVIMDEIDSGLDIDALQKVGEIIKEITEEGSSIIIITHYKRLIDHVKIKKVHVMRAGRIVGKGGIEVIEKIEKDGYKSV